MSAIVSSIVGLGQSLHVTITAEGVETEDHAEILKQWGCDQVQGFYCGRPETEVAEGINPPSTIRASLEIGGQDGGLAAFRRVPLEM